MPRKLDASSEPEAVGTSGSQSGNDGQRDTDFAMQQRRPHGSATKVSEKPANRVHSPDSAPVRSESTSQLTHSPSIAISPDFRAGMGVKSVNRDSLQHERPSLKARANALLTERKRLPVWSHSANIRRALREKDILILVGETGSGKSTQIPQMLLDEPWFQNSGNSGHSTKPSRAVGCIAVTEPRRVAAINLARRVAEEMGTPMGTSSPASKVGYAVRFDNSTGPNTQIKFLTEGMLLQEMLRNPYLIGYSAIVVDEVHERGADVDLVLSFLRRMVVEGYGKDQRCGRPLKVVVMSATAEVEKLIEFFGQHSVACATNRTPTLGTVEKSGEELNVTSSNGTAGIDDLHSEWSGISDGEEADCLTGGYGSFKSSGDSTIPPETNGTLPPKSENQSENVALCYIEGRQYNVEVHYITNPVADYLSAALTAIFQLHHSEPMPGDVLVFLTGREVVESLEHLLNEHSVGLGPGIPRLLALPLFAALPQPLQQRVFHPAPKRTRKVILATNIAETSLTVPGVRHVIDCGKAKVKMFRANIGLESLLVKPISKSSAVQRKGRAGREAAGKCYRLYTEESYLEMEDNNTPEILRSDLSHVLLTLKARGVDDVLAFPMLDRPPIDALQRALVLLHQLDGLDDDGKITDIGARMARFPLPVTLGRTLLAAASNDCIEDVIDIISCLTTEEPPFRTLTAEDAREAADTARRRSQLYRREGDHLTLLALMQQYSSLDTQSSVATPIMSPDSTLLSSNKAIQINDHRRWCDDHYISHRAMRAAMDVRKQLRALFNLPSTSSRAHLSSTTLVDSSLSETILKAFLVGFSNNTARLCPDGSYKTLIGNQNVKIHPSSVLFTPVAGIPDANGDQADADTTTSSAPRKVECIMYNEFVYTNRAYARIVSAVQMPWVGNIFAERGMEGQRSY